MTQQILNVGLAPNDHTGDSIRVGAQKTNANFTELYSQAPTGYLSVTVAVATINDYNPGSGWPSTVGKLDINPSAVNTTLNGMVAGANGQTVLIRNIGAFNLTFSYENAGSANANRFTGAGSGMTLPPGFRTYAVYYTSPNPRWSIG